ncbi:MAG: hypothetical protein QY322_02290 [bacterium]|nr:MAG: hypothetical protein QY322_02290 [bacterium]
MTERKKPTKEFKYPDGSRMCVAGKVRASWWSQLISKGDLTEEDLIKLAGKGEYAVARGADTNKINYIAMMVYRHLKSGDLEEYTTDGQFISNNIIQNVNDNKFAYLIRQIFGGGDNCD